MKILINDVQFESYTPDPSRGMGRTSRRFKRGERLEIWTDEKTIFIQAGDRVIAVPYARAVWLEHGPTQGTANTGGGKRARSTKSKSGLSKTPLPGTESALGRPQSDESSPV